MIPTSPSAWNWQLCLGSKYSRGSDFLICKGTIQMTYGKRYLGTRKDYQSFTSYVDHIFRSDHTRSHMKQIEPSMREEKTIFGVQRTTAGSYVSCCFFCGHVCLRFWFTMSRPSVSCYADVEVVDVFFHVKSSFYSFSSPESIKS